MVEFLFYHGYLIDKRQLLFRQPRLMDGGMHVERVLRQGIRERILAVLLYQNSHPGVRSPDSTSEHVRYASGSTRAPEESPRTSSKM